MAKSSVENNTKKVNTKKTIYKFKCLKCANCCESGIKIYISKKDIINWEKLHRKDFLKFIQICPTTISPLYLSKIEKKIRKKLLEFIISNHNYERDGDGFVIERPYLKRNWNSRPILNPRSFDVINKGIELGLKYMISNEFNAKCPFLKDNLCSIHKIKPIACVKFPYYEPDKVCVENHILEICKGIKKIG